jgi:hypothetical protein
MPPPREQFSDLLPVADSMLDNAMVRVIDAGKF